jgi:hypothetical protein
MPLATSAACLPRQIGAPVVARGRAHQHAHRHLVCCGRPQWVWMSREVSPEVPDTSVLLFLRYVHVRSDRVAGHCGHDDGGRSIAAAGEPSSGGVGWAGLTLWELCGTAGGLWALLEGKTESALNVLEVRSSSN